MAERDDIIASIAETTSDYRDADGEGPTPDRIECWINQFGPNVQLPILQEMDYVLKQTYFSRTDIKQFLARLFKNKKLVGDNPCTFWKDVKFLDIQNRGASQNEMLALFSKVLKKECGFEVFDCGEKPHTFVYLDDAIFTGNRVLNDLKTWIANKAPTEAKVYVIVIALHSNGRSYANREIRKVAKVAGKTIDLKFWRLLELENCVERTDTSDVLRPVTIPDDGDVKAYVEAMYHQPVLRKAGSVGSKRFFSSDAGRQLLETEFLKAGVRIRKICPNLNQYQKPLGNMVLDTLGFGSLIVTYRNCPNNAPLALWVTNPWRPLFIRKTN